MKTYTIPQKMSGTGSIHDLASDQYDREILFRGSNKYAVILAAFYGGNSFTSHNEINAIRQSRRLRDFSHSIIDYNGNEYCINDRFDIDTLLDLNCLGLSGRVYATPSLAMRW